MPPTLWCPPQAFDASSTRFTLYKYNYKHLSIRLLPLDDTLRSRIKRGQGVRDGPNSLAKAVGMVIYEKRKTLGLTQAALAEKLGIGQQSLSRIEQGRMAPKFERLQDIADVLECSVADLFYSADTDAAKYANLITELLVSLTEEERVFVVEQNTRLVKFLKKQRTSPQKPALGLYRSVP